MPHLAFHMSVARDLANVMQNPTINADRGAFYMGSTGPDMRILSRADRMSSHFFDLDCLEEQDASKAFFAAHADLQDPGLLDTATASFVAGYLTHLVIDEIWITDIYRPFFGPDSSLHGDARANVLDRVLQYDIDLQCRTARAVMDEVRNEILATSLDVHAGFVDQDILDRWRDIVVDMVSRPAGWERFARTASRFLAVAGVSSEDEIEQFMKTLPALLEETKEHVGEEQIASFLVKANALTLKTLEEYLS